MIVTIEGMDGARMKIGAVAAALPTILTDTRSEVGDHFRDRWARQVKSSGGEYGAPYKPVSAKWQKTKDLFFQGSNLPPMVASGRTRRAFTDSTSSDRIDRMPRPDTLELGAGGRSVTLVLTRGNRRMKYKGAPGERLGYHAKTRPVVLVDARDKRAVVEIMESRIEDAIHG